MRLCMDKPYGCVLTDCSSDDRGSDSEIRGSSLYLWPGVTGAMDYSMRSPTLTRELREDVFNGDRSSVLDKHARKENLR